MADDVWDIERGAPYAPFSARASLDRLGHFQYNSVMLGTFSWHGLELGTVLTIVIRSHASRRHGPSGSLLLYPQLGI
jgi:hypothetical protein